ncbi:uncharacterized protein [Drosophila suzukii]|uniref:Uncharacterized protein isoform X2 n=1 Tax=Drosophila suzukii TaxID=28584 RepID=A0AB40DDY1_DROSZ
MPLNIKKVLVCDAVDKSCVELLEQHGINVTYKLKLPVEELCQEVKHSGWQFYFGLRADVHPNWLPGPSRRPRRSEHEGGSLGQEALCRHRALWKNPGRPGTGTHWSRGRHSHEDLGHADYRIRSHHHRGGGQGGRHREDDAGGDLATGGLHNRAHAADPSHQKSHIDGDPGQVQAGCQGGKCGPRRHRR